MIFEAEPRTPNPHAMVTVHAIRHDLAELAAAHETLYHAYWREQRLLDWCRRHIDYPLIRRMVNEVGLELEQAAA